MECPDAAKPASARKIIIGGPSEGMDVDACPALAIPRGDDSLHGPEIRVLIELDDDDIAAIQVSRHLWLCTFGPLPVFYMEAAELKGWRDAERPEDP